MKNKLLKIISFGLVLLSLFSTVAFARTIPDRTDRKGFDSLENNPKNKQEYVQLETVNEVCNAEFFRFIDPNEYGSKIGEPGFDNFQIVGIDEYYRPKSELSYYVLYVFNPTSIYLNYPYEELEEGMKPATDISYFQVHLLDSENNLKTVMCETEANGHIQPRGTFVRIFIPSVDIYGTEFRLTPTNRKFSIVSFQIGDLCGDLSPHIFVMQSFEFSGFNENKTLICSKTNYSCIKALSPFFELSIINDEALYDIQGDFSNTKSYYPYDEDGKYDVVYFNEIKNGNQLDLYLYLYCPNKIYPVGDLTVDLFNESKFVWESVVFKYVSKDETMVKYCFSVDPNENNYRNYYLTDIKFSIPSIEQLYSIQDTYHFTFSNTPLDDYTSPAFTYIRDLTVKGNIGDTIILSVEDERIDSIKFENFDSNKFKVFENENALNYVKFEIIDSSPNNEYSFGIELSTEFPLTSNSIKFQITLKGEIISEDGESSGDSSGSGGNSYTSNTLIGYSPSSFTQVRNFSNTRNSNNSTESALYLKGKKSGKLNISASYTDYFIDSSIKGNNYYQTLTSLYFTLPESIFGEEVFGSLFGTRYVSSILMQYEAAMLQPGIIYEKDSDAAHNINRIQNGIYNRLGSWVSSDFISGGTMGTSVVSVIPSGFFFGNHDGNYLFIPSNLIAEYNKFPYAIEYDGEWKSPFEDEDSLGPVLSSEEFLSYVGNDIKLYEDLQSYKKVVNFNDEFKLQSFLDLDWREQAKHIGFFTALFHHLGFSDDTLDESITFKGIETLRGDELTAALLLSDKEFSDKYAIGLSDVSDAKEKIANCISNDEAFILLRFDIYDYYCAEGRYGYSDFSDLVSTDIDISGQQYIFQTKYYKDVDILQLQTDSFLGSKQVFDVFMEPLTFAGSLHQPPSLDDSTEDAGDAIGDAIVNVVINSGNASNKDKLLVSIISIIMLVGLVIVLTIFFPGVMMPILKGCMKILAKIFEFSIKCILRVFDFIKSIFKKRE